MFSLSIALMFLGCLALVGFRWWLDRTHPSAGATEIDGLTALSDQVSRLQQEMQDFKLGSAFQGRKKRVDEEDI